MDRALLERMIGAAVLVLLFVVFVPALLDGRQKPQDLMPSAGGKRTEVIVLNAPRNEPAPEADPVPVQQEPIVNPPPQPVAKVVAKAEVKEPVASKPVVSKSVVKEPVAPKPVSKPEPSAPTASAVPY